MAAPAALLRQTTEKRIKAMSRERYEQAEAGARAEANQWERHAQHVALSDRAARYLDQAEANGEPFSEALCNWAVDKARGAT
tara:strand:+ start:298 stop:543 length:246 start_codon:yes stop_codon:yes gene_type:complete